MEALEHRPAKARPSSADVIWQADLVARESKTLREMLLNLLPAPGNPFEDALGSDDDDRDH